MSEKNVIKLNSECIKCLLNKYLKQLPCKMDEDTKIKYFQNILKIISEINPTASAPEIVAKITTLQKEMFGKTEDYTELKKYYNALMDSLGKDLSENIAKSTDGFRLAMSYSMLGNYIDFGAMDSVDETKLKEMLKNASNIVFDNTEYENLKADLAKSEKLVFITDNCGEIALDKLFMTKIKKDYPNLQLQIIVRGNPVLNDATIEDALQIGLEKIAKVTPNGSNIAGTCIDKISNEAKSIIDSADIIIAKGQGNFETMCYCKKNVYYLFLCKCQLFADRHNVPRFTPMLLNDLRMN